jgi:hypothetical protein
VKRRFKKFAAATDLTKLFRERVPCLQTVRFKEAVEKHEVFFRWCSPINVIPLVFTGKCRRFAEIAEPTGCRTTQSGEFISGTLTKKMGLKVESEKTEAGDMTYRIAQ